MVLNKIFSYNWPFRNFETVADAKAEVKFGSPKLLGLQMTSPSIVPQKTSSGSEI